MLIYGLFKLYHIKVFKSGNHWIHSNEQKIIFKLKYEPSQIGDIPITDENTPTWIEFYYQENGRVLSMRNFRLGNGTKVKNVV